jgi:hypothetical protein
MTTIIEMPYVSPPLKTTWPPPHMMQEHQSSKEGNVTGSSCQTHVDEYFTLRPATGVNRDNAYHKCTHYGGVYHVPTQCPVIIVQTHNYLLYRKTSSIPIPSKPKEGVLTSNRYLEHVVKPLPKRTKKLRP